jgi:hypothetical protein
MPVLQDATNEEIARLLELFPVVDLRGTWPALKAKHKTKAELCTAIAVERQYATIINFVDAFFGCAKQHVYVYERDKAIQWPAAITEGERVKSTATRQLYIARLVRGVVMQDPLEHSTITFLWPVRVDTHTDYAVVRFVILAKNLSPYFPRKAYPTTHGLTEAEALQSILSAHALAAADLNKGIKKLLRDEFMDGHYVKYKTSDSTASETMDNEKGIRQNKPELFKTLLKSPLNEMFFKIAKDQKLSIEEFSANPTVGTLAFHSYSNKAGDTDRVIREILQSN